MLQRLQLIESNKVHATGRAVGSSAISTVVHAVLIVGAVFASGTAHVVRETLRDTSFVFVPPPAPDQPPPEEVEPPAVRERLATLVAPAQGFQTVVPPSEIPTEIPPIDLTQSFDPRNYTGRGVEGGVAWGDPTARETIDVSKVWVEAVVQERPERLSCPVPRYPEVLRNAMIEGRVIVNFVIGIDGKADPSTMDVVEATNSGFISSAREVIASCTFRPGRMYGQPVKTLVRMPVTFRLIDA